jgi:protein-tyrosine sulfotransferase
VTTDPAARAPVIVLAPAYAGAGALRSLLAVHPDLACTAGTGLLPLCEQAMSTWRNADGRRGGAPSSLASAATRALAASFITSILAREGKSRWCEVAAASPEAARTFLRLYPQTRFLCLYRACPDVIRAVLDASRWGITDPVLAPFTTAYPASTVASLTAYWIATTGPLLAFEHEHPRSCLRIRYEDVVAARRETAASVAAFLGLDDHAGSGPGGGRPQPAPETLPGPEPDFPVELIPPRMLVQASDLLGQLGYPALPGASSRPAAATAGRPGD